MSTWDLRQYIESHTPWWVIPLSIVLAGMIYGWIEFTSYAKKRKL
jgi:hypothetical protein